MSFVLPSLAVIHLASDLVNPAVKALVSAKQLLDIAPQPGHFVLEIFSLMISIF